MSWVVWAVDFLMADSRGFYNDIRLVSILAGILEPNVVAPINIVASGLNRFCHGLYLLQAFRNINLCSPKRWKIADLVYRQFQTVTRIIIKSKLVQKEARPKASAAEPLHVPSMLWRIAKRNSAIATYIS